MHDEQNTHSTSLWIRIIFGEDHIPCQFHWSSTKTDKEKCES